jgi:hypothetical protein
VQEREVLLSYSSGNPFAASAGHGTVIDDALPTPHAWALSCLAFRVSSAHIIPEEVILCEVSKQPFSASFL